MERIRSRRTTLEQRMKLLQYLKEHPELVKGGHFSPTERADTWNELARILNSVDGPKKSADRWLKSFHDWKSDVRNKKRALQNNESAPPLTKNEKQLLKLMNELQEDEDGDSDDPLLPKPFPSLDVDALKPEPRPMSDSEPDFLSEPDRPPARTSRRASAPLKRKRTRETNNDEDDKEYREERAIRAMEGQAASLDRMASAMERIADVIASAVQATLGANKDL